MCLNDKIDSWIESHSKEMLDDIHNLISIKSISSIDFNDGFGEECNKALKYLLELGEKYGFDTKNYENYCIGSLWNNGGKTIGIWGHLDIVPEGENWLYDPYKPIVVNDFIIGRGSQDNKGPTIATLFAIRCLKDLNIPFKNSILHIAGCDEENQMRDAQYFVDNYKVPDLSLIADCAFPVCYGEKGLCEFIINSKYNTSKILKLNGGSVSNMVADYAEIIMKKDDYIETIFNNIEQFKVESFDDYLKISTKGKSAHVANPKDGENAILKLCEQMYKLNYFIEDDEKLIRQIINLSSSNYGDIFNIAYKDEISGELTCVNSVVKYDKSCISALFNMRYPITTDINKVIDNIKLYCKKNNFDLTILKNQSPSYFENKDIINKLTDIYNKETDQNLQPYIMGGGTYAKKIPNALGFGIGMENDIGTINLPKGHGNCHCPDEVQSISNLKKSIKIYVKALIELDKMI